MNFKVVPSKICEDLRVEWGKGATKRRGTQRRQIITDAQNYTICSICISSFNFDNRRYTKGSNYF